MPAEPGTLADMSRPQNVETREDGAVNALTISWRDGSLTHAKDAEKDEDAEFPVVVLLGVGDGELPGQLGCGADASRDDLPGQDFRSQKD